MQENTISILKHLNFTEYETRAYLALLSKNKVSASEVAELSNIPLNKIYKVLSGVERKGGCVVVQRTKKLFEPIAPEILFDSARNKLKVEMAELEKNISTVEEQLQAVYENQLDSDDGVDYIKLYKNPLTATSKIYELLTSANNECLQFSMDRSYERTSKKIDESLFEEQSKKDSELLFKLANEKGVLFRIISTAENLSPLLIYTLRNYYYSCDGFDLRVVDKVPFKAQIFDNKDILLSLRNPRDTGYSEVFAHIQDSLLVAELKLTFYKYYNQGISFKELDLDILMNERKVVKKKR